jgi:fluoride exporter
MTMAAAVWIALGGGLGAVLRHGANDWLRADAPAPSRRGTILVNLCGAFLAGWLVARLADAPGDDPLWLLLGLGFLGSLTTFSTWMIEVVDLGRSDRGFGALLHLAGLLGTGLLVAWMGFRLGG